MHADVFAVFVHQPDHAGPKSGVRVLGERRLHFCEEPGKHEVIRAEKVYEFSGTKAQSPVGIANTAIAKVPGIAYQAREGIALYGSFDYLDTIIRGYVVQDDEFIGGTSCVTTDSMHLRKYFASLRLGTITVSEKGSLFWVKCPIY